MVHAERLTVVPREPFVVFLIGARVNRWWMLPAVWAVASAFERMSRQLEADPESGLIHAESWFGRSTITVQYWRSLDDLVRYAHDKERAHKPVWREWAERWGLSGAVGIWHETYQVDPGSSECVYHHMPAFGLGAVGPLEPAVGPLTSARGRLREGKRRAAAAQTA